MKGLFLKDFYLMIKYCRAYLVIIAVFIPMSFIIGHSSFYFFYPCVLAGMIPATLLAYDEQSRWDRYCGTLPVSRAQVVSEKYLVGLFIQMIVWLLSGTVQGIRMGLDGEFVLNQYLLLLAILLFLSCVPSVIVLPLMFKMGVEKGRGAYYVVIGVVCAVVIASQSIFRVVFETGDFENFKNIISSFENIISSPGFLLLLFLASIALYAVSWRLSILFYEKREEE